MNNYTIWGLASIAIFTVPLLAQKPLILKQFQDTKWEAPYDGWLLLSTGWDLARTQARAHLVGRMFVKSVGAGESI